VQVEKDNAETIRREKAPLRAQASQWHVACGTDKWDNGFIHPDGACGGRGGAAYFELDGNDIVQVEKDSAFEVGRGFKEDVMDVLERYVN
jgi:hypothetical protein